MSAILNSPAFAVLALLVGWVLAYGPPEGWREKSARASSTCRVKRD